MKDSIEEKRIYNEILKIAFAEDDSTASSVGNKLKALDMACKNIEKIMAELGETPEDGLIDAIKKSSDVWGGKE